MSSMGVAVTGASGFIGSSLIVQLREIGVETILELGRDDAAWSEKAYSEKGWLNVLSRANTIFYFGGNTDIEWAEQNPGESLDQAITPIRNLISAAEKNKKNVRVIYASTATVYGAETFGLVSELVLPQPCTIYDLHKHYIEGYLNLASMGKNFKAISLRLSNIYGPSLVRNKNSSRGILNQMIIKAMNGDILRLYVGHELRRDYLYISDLIDALLQCAYSIKFKFGVYNMSSGKSVPMEQVISFISQSVANQIGKSVAVEKVPFPNDVNKIHHRNYDADIRKIQHEFNWFPKTSLEDGINKTVNNLKSKGV